MMVRLASRHPRGLRSCTMWICSKKDTLRRVYAGATFSFGYVSASRFKAYPYNSAGFPAHFYRTLVGHFKDLPGFETIKGSTTWSYRGHWADDCLCGGSSAFRVISTSSHLFLLVVGSFYALRHRAMETLRWKFRSRRLLQEYCPDVRTPTKSSVG
jgi:hypothetical protein